MSHQQHNRKIYSFAVYFSVICPNLFVTLNNHPFTAHGWTMDDNNKNTVTVFTVETKGNCFLCLQHYVEESKEKSGGTVSLKFLSRYLNLDIRQVFNVSSVSVLENAQIVAPVCDDCLILTKQFSSWYEQLDLVKMKLKACVKNMHDVMVQAEKDFGLEYRERILKTENPEDVISLGIVQNLRKETISKSSFRLQQCYPRLKLARLTSKETTKYKRMEQFEENNTSGTTTQPSSHLYNIEKSSGAESVNVNRVSSSMKITYTLLANRKYKCDACHKIVKAGSFLLHTRTHGDKLTTCDLCGTGFKFNSDLTRHKMTVHKEIFFKTCKDSRLTADKFKSAVNEAFSNFQLQKIAKKYFCPFCKTNNALQKSELAPHIIRYHKREFFPMIMAAQSKYITGNIDDDDDAAVNIPQLSKCTSLGKQAKTSLSLKTCKYCNLLCRRKNMDTHVYTRHPLQLFYQYKAPELTDLLFQNVVNNAINAFLLSDSDRGGDTDYKCQLCKRKFSRRRILVAHVVKYHFQDVASALENSAGYCSENIICDDEDESMVSFDSLVPNSTTVASQEPSTDTFLFDKILPDDIDNSEDNILPPPNLTKQSSYSVEIEKREAVRLFQQSELFAKKNSNKGTQACNFCRNRKIGTKVWDIHSHILKHHWSAILSKFKDPADNGKDSETKLRKLVRGYVNGLSKINNEIKCSICEKTFHTIIKAELHILQDHMKELELKKSEITENPDVGSAVNDNFKKEAIPEHFIVDDYLFGAILPHDNVEACVEIVNEEIKMVNFVDVVEPKLEGGEPGEGQS